MPRYGEQEAKEAVAASRSFSEALRKLGMRPAGGNHRLLKSWVKRWQIPTDHFDAGASLRRRPSQTAKPLREVLTQGSAYSRNNLKQRLFREGLKERHCELCGQDENWRGRTMSLILDHINGVPDDNRLENADCRPKLRCDARHALWAQEPTRTRDPQLQTMRERVPSEIPRSPLLLALLWVPLGSREVAG